MLITDELLLQKVCVACTEMTEFTTQGLASTGWAFAALACADALFLRVFPQRLLGLLPQMRAQELANVAWACATLNLRGRPLMDALEKQVVSTVRGFGERDLAEMS